MASPEQLDAILAVQLAVAWAGESGDDEPRLRWWETDLVSKYGGQALFEQLAPRTAPWAVLEATREAARRVDEKARQRDAEPDRLVSLFYLGFDLDEQLQDRLLEHKRRRTPPADALPGFGELTRSWDKDRLVAWATAGDKPNVASDPTGRRLTGSPPPDPVELVRRLAHALVPLADAYPLPHYRNG